MVRTWLIASLAAALLGSTALAQSAAGGEDDPDIVVTGPRAEPPSWSESTGRARSITAPTGIRHAPLPRFEGDRLCPGVFGLKRDYAALVIDRIRAHAESLDIRMAEDDGTCRPNLVVAFVDDGQAALKHYADTQPWLFRGMPRHERLALLREEGPARAWTTTMTRTRDGMTISETQTGVGVVHLWSASSKGYLPTRQDINGVLVLFDREGVRGKSLMQLADYATMRGLAHTKSVRADSSGVATILALFDPAAAPAAAMTDFDRAYLTSLYSGMPNLPGLTKVLGVSKHLERLTRAGSAGSNAGR